MSEQQSTEKAEVEERCTWCGWRLSEPARITCQRPIAHERPAETVLPVDVAVGRALRTAVHEHVMFTETEGGIFDGEWGISGAYHWCGCGWRSDDGPWRDAQTYINGMAQAREDHLSNAMNAAVREHVSRAQAEVANAFVAWAAANEIVEPPLDWAWFGEIARRYSPLHEGYAERVTPSASVHEFNEDVNDGSMCTCGVPALTHDQVYPPGSGEPKTGEGGCPAAPGAVCCGRPDLCNQEARRG